MKKLFLFFILGFFLISFTTASINISSTEIPQFEFNLVSGGDLEIGSTYYMQGIIGGYNYYGEASSPTSIEYSFTPNSTHRQINISWANQCEKYNFHTIYPQFFAPLFRWNINESFIKDWSPSGYLPWAFDSNTSYYGHQKWTGNYGRGDNPNNFWKCSNSQDWYLINSVHLLDSTTSASRSVQHPQIAMLPSEMNPLANQYNISKGKIEICILDDEISTLNDLIKELLNQNHSDIINYLNWTGGNFLTLMGVIGNCDGTLQLKDDTLSLINGGIYNDNFIANNSNIIFNDPKFRWNQPKGNYYNSKIQKNGGNSWILDSLGTISNTQFSGDDNTHYGSYDGFIFDSIPQHQSRYPRNIHYHKNSKWINTKDYITPSSNYLNQTAIFENNYFQNNNLKNYDIFLGFTYVDNCYGKGTYNILDMNNVFSDREDGKLIYYASPKISPSNWCDYQYNISHRSDSKIKILDESGFPIEEVNITSFNFRELDTNLTNSEGITYLNIDNYLAFYSPNTKWLNYTLYGEHNLTIEKEGYYSYTAYLNFTQPLDLTITLKEKNWNYSSPLKWEILNQSDITILKLDENGNMAIAGELFEYTNSSEHQVLYDNGKWKLDIFGNLYIIGRLLNLVI